ncbi:MAG: hypothetical protein EOO20_24675, partial [Chryseobacterium sp.]
MKSILLLNFLLISIFSAVRAQEKYRDIQSKVKTAEKAYSFNDPNYKFLYNIYTGFGRSDKLSLANLSKSNVGVAIVLSEPGSGLIVYPAKYTFGNNKVNISTIRSKTAGGLTEDMKDFVQKYLYKMEAVGSTKLFRQLMSDKPKTEGTFTQNSTEFIINEPNTLSFVRGDEDWMFVVSIDDQYKTLEKPRIIMYAFK